MSTATQTLHAEIAGDERAIRHLIGERAALTSKLRREEALLKLRENRLLALSTRNHPAVGTGGAIPHGERFPDVSSYQPNVDWHAVRHDSGIRVGDLAVTKLSEGLTWSDHYGNLRLREMHAQGFPHRGAYHFLHPSESPLAQAQHFLTVAHENGVQITASDILCCDCEVSDGQSQAVASCARLFALEVRKHTPARLWLYGGGPFLHEHGVTLAGYDAHWLAAYTANPHPYMIYGAPRTVAWQYTDSRYGPTPHVCPGIGGCDMSIVL